MAWDGDDYQARFDALAARGVDVHGEVAFLLGLDPVPATVLDAGCGTGRVAIELAERGVAVVGRRRRRVDARVRSQERAGDRLVRTRPRRRSISAGPSTWW